MSIFGAASDPASAPPTLDAGFWVADNKQRSLSPVDSSFTTMFGVGMPSSVSRGNCCIFIYGTCYMPVRQHANTLDRLSATRPAIVWSTVNLSWL